MRDEFMPFHPLLLGLLVALLTLPVAALPPEPPLCSDFNDGTTQGWQASNVTFSIASRREDPSDGFLYVTDLPNSAGGPLSLVLSSQEYSGDWTRFLPESCGQLCFDIQIFDDDLPGQVVPFHPRITLFSQSDPDVRVTFRSNLTIDETTDEWVRVCAPISAELPESGEGEWSANPGLPGTWSQVLTDVGGVRLPIELGGASEEIGYDNVCLQTSPDCPSCGDPVDETVLCTVDGSGDYVYRFRFENRHGHDAHHLFLLDLPAGVTATPSHFDLVQELGAPLADGAVSDELEVRFSGTGGLDEIPFRFSIHDEPVEECCAREHTIELPDCECSQVIDGSASCTLLLGPKGSDEQIAYNFQLQNLSTGPAASYVLVTSPDGELVQASRLAPPLGYGDTVTLNLPITTPSRELPDGDLCFQVSTHDQSLGECCSIEHCVPSPKPCLPTIYTPLGVAELCPPDDTFHYWRLTDVGSSGDDGVELDFGAVEGFKVTWRDLQETAAPPDGAFLRFNATGVVDGESGRELGEMRVTDVGEAMEISADYSSVGSATKRLELYRGGELLEVIEGFPGDTIGRAPLWPTGCGKRLVVIDGIRTWCYWPEWPQPFLFEIPGRPAVMIDSIRVIAEGPAEPLGALQSFRLQAADIDPIDFTSVQAVLEDGSGAATTVSLDTGYDDGAAADLPGGAADDDWRVLETGEAARVVERPAGAWKDELERAAWISVEAERGRSEPDRRFTTYERCFCLGSGGDAVALTLDLRADDRAIVRLNGQVLGGPGGRFNGPEPLHVDATGSAGDGLFRSGENCLEVEVDDRGSVVTGLLVQGSVQGAGEVCLP